MPTTPEVAGSSSSHGRILLEAAAHLIEKRAAALRTGAAPLDPIAELELASQTIRKLAAEIGRLQDARLIADAPGGTGRDRTMAVRTPPVLVRSSGRRAA